MMYALVFDKRTDGGPPVVGPFASDALAFDYVEAMACNALAYRVLPMEVVGNPTGKSSTLDGLAYPEHFLRTGIRHPLDMD